jgi:hypothetical protein
MSAFSYDRRVPRREKTPKPESNERRDHPRTRVARDVRCEVGPTSAGEGHGAANARADRPLNEAACAGGRRGPISPRRPIVVGSRPLRLRRDREQWRRDWLR